MATPLSIDISATGQLRIGLIVRGKMGPDHHPGKLSQHADCILDDGAPIGFFGELNDWSGNKVGLGMQGVVYDYEAMRRNRPYYVSMEDAISYRIVSTVLLIGVDKATAVAFRKAWGGMAAEPGEFNIVGGNCATHASAAFIQAKIVAKQIPGLDTPDNLYSQLVAASPAGRTSSLTGFIGFTRKAGGGFSLDVTPYADTPHANRPKPSSSVSL